MPKIIPTQIWVSDPCHLQTERSLKQTPRQRCGRRRSATASRARPIFPRRDLGQTRCCASIRKTPVLIAKSIASAADVKPALEADGLFPRLHFNYSGERSVLEN